MGSQDVQCSPSLLVGASFLFMTFPRKVLPVLISSLYSRESSYRISFQALLFPSILSLTRKQRIRIHLRIVFVGAVSTTYGAEGLVLWGFIIIHPVLVQDPFKQARVEQLILHNSLHYTGESLFQILDQCRGSRPTEGWFTLEFLHWFCCDRIFHMRFHNLGSRFPIS